MEIWKNVIGYEDLYKVSSLGIIRRKIGYQSKTERVLKPLNNGNNYMSVALSKNGKVKRMYVHRIVCLSFYENSKNKKEVNHIDGNRQNNKSNNLEWVTRSENHFHRYKVLKQKGVNFGKTGSKNWRSKEVNQFSLEGVFLKKYPAVMSAMRDTGIGESNIRGCIYGRSKTAGGYKWQYA